MCDLYGYEPEERSAELRGKEPQKVAVPILVLRSKRK
jgi:hypothetical protein